MKPEIELFETFEVAEITEQTRAIIPQYDLCFWCYYKGPVD